MERRYLVTGAEGCLGAWVLKNLVERSTPVVAFDRDASHRRPRLLLDEAALRRVTFVQGDLSDTDQLVELVEREAITHIVHLAALQIPFCRAEPALGARVNVVGTVNVLEAARRSQGRVSCVAYASSAAVFGPRAAYLGQEPLGDDAPLLPRTLYGVYKQANEGTARVYWLDYGVRSVGLRPWAVYGVGRDQGVTSEPTRAMKAAVLGRPFAMSLGGRMDMQYADDVAKLFIACAEAAPEGAPVFNVRGTVASMEEIVAEIERQWPPARGLISVGTTEVDIAVDLDDAGLRRLLGTVPRTSLAEGIAATVRAFEALHAAGRLDDAELPAR